MSTSYYRLRPPVTHLMITENQGKGHDVLSIWINRDFAGWIEVDTKTISQLLNIFFLYKEDNECPLRTHWGGSVRGTVVTINDDTLPGGELLMSEYGELITVAEVKARDGIKRTDGLPTELVGYEKGGNA